MQHIAIAPSTGENIASKLTSEHVAVVLQPACANVFLIKNGVRVARLAQYESRYCRAYASGYAQALGMPVFEYTCKRGDAAVMSWEVK